MAEIRNYTMNLGPQHPAAHGVLRLVLELDGEVIQRADPHIGLLHRATEKLAEYKTYIQSLPNMDRLDYVSMMCNEHAYCLAIEPTARPRGSGERAQYIRVMFDELTRILNHLLWLGCHSLDIGGMTTFLYCFREREDLFDMYEAVSARDAPGLLPAGRRLPRPAGPDAPVPGGAHLAQRPCDERDEREPSGLAARLHRGLHQPVPGYVDDYETLLTENRIWKQRTVGIGVVTAERAIALGFTGAMLRGSGVEWDLRRKQPYAIYDRIGP